MNVSLSLVRRAPSTQPNTCFSTHRSTQRLRWQWPASVLVHVEITKYAAYIPKLPSAVRLKTLADHDGKMFISFPQCVCRYSHLKFPIGSPHQNPQHTQLAHACLISYKAKKKAPSVSSSPSFLPPPLPSRLPSSFTASPPLPLLSSWPLSSHPA